MDDLNRRGFIKEAALAAAGAAALTGCSRAANPDPETQAPTPSTPPPIVRSEALGQPPWPTSDPFLFCVYHQDEYPAGNDAMGPQTTLTGRNLGMDFSGKDGWSMYHGRQVPGFPRHPHRGFETVTVVKTGYLDHSDSLGATARIGPGDVQWMTAGRGISHAEMFPLREREAGNPTEFFQIWMNLPGKNKMVAPHFTMMWDDEVPVHRIADARGKVVTVRTVAGELAGERPPDAPPDSWAGEPGANIAMWTIHMSPGSRWTLPQVPEGVERSLYFFEGAELVAGGTAHTAGHRLTLDGHGPLELSADPRGSARLLLLQGRPIGEPVARHGPFVMNTQEELKQAYADYRRDQFGGWPWPSDAPVHKREEGRFAIHADGKREEPS